jgi:hypothetical protein
MLDDRLDPETVATCRAILAPLFEDVDAPSDSEIMDYARAIAMWSDPLPADIPSGSLDSLELLPGAGNVIAIEAEIRLALERERRRTDD